MSERLNTELRKLLDARAAHEQASAAEKRTKKAKDRQAQLVHDMLTGLKVKSHTVDLGERYGTVRVVPRSTVYHEILDQDTAEKGLRDAGLDDIMLKPTVRKGVLNEHVREWIENGQPFPPGVGFRRDIGVTVTRRS